MTDAERTLLLLLAASVRADMTDPWNNNRPRDAAARAESIKDLVEKIQADVTAANDNPTEGKTDT